MSRLCVVTALPSEARAWVDRYRLSPVRSAPFRLWRGDDAAVIAGGIGAAACMAAAGYLAGVTGSRRTSVWINAGIAGHRHLPRGALAVVAKSVDGAVGARGDAYYPSLPVRCRLPLLSCVSVESIETEFAEDALYDMECAAYFAAASRFSCLDLVHAVKIVSDNRAQGPGDLDRGAIGELVAGAMTDIVDFLVDPLLSLASQIEEEYAETDLSAFLKAWHFSVANENRLRTLVADWRALHEGSIPDAGAFASCRGASEVIAAMKRALELPVASA